MARPTYSGVVPRVLDKVHAKVRGDIAAARGLRGWIDRAACRAAVGAVRRRGRGQRPGLLGRLLSGVRAAVQAAIDRANARLARAEQIKKFAILPCDFSIEGGELTPTLKVKRREVDAKYAAILDSLYAEAPPARAAAPW